MSWSLIKRSLKMTCLTPFFIMAFAAGPVNAQSLDKASTAEAPPPSVVSKAGIAEEKVPLSLNSVILFALSDNPDVRMAQARTTQAQASADKARAPYFPQVDFTSEVGQEYNRPASDNANKAGSSNPSWGLSLTISQLLYDFGRTGANYDQQKQFITSSVFDKQVNVEDTMTSAIESYLDVLEFQETLKESTAFVERIRELQKTVTQMFEAGASSKTMVDYANSRLAAAETNNNTLRANMNDAISNIEFLTGPLPPFEAIQPDDLDPARMDLQVYLDMAEKDNTGVKLSASDIKALEYKLEVSKKAFFPTFSFGFNADKRFDDGGRSGRDDEVQGMLRMNYRLYDGGERSSDVRLVRGQIEEANINQEKIRKELKRLIRQSYNQIVSIQESRKQTAKEIASSEGLQKLNRENFEQGSINLIELIEGEERLNAARQRMHTLNSDLYLNTFGLLITAGLLEQNFFCGTCQQGS